MQIDFIIGVGITPPPTIKDPSERWHARFWERGDAAFYAGNGRTPWEAIAFALDEMAHRRAGIIRMAVDPLAPATMTPSVGAIHAAKIERTKEAMRLPIAGACTKTKSAAARRSRAKKTK